MRVRIGGTVWNSEEDFLVSWCDGLHEWSLISSAGSLLRSRAGVKKGCGYRNIIGMVLGEAYVESLSSSDGVICG